MSDLYDLIPGVGPVPAHGMLVGEAGGINEARTGRPFCGKAGSVLTTYLKAAGLARNELFVTNVMPRWPGPGNPEPTAAQIAEHEHYLYEDLARVRPRVVAAVGRVAARWFLGDVSLEQVHGVPCWSKKTSACVVPTIHPAASFYNPALAAFCQEDFMRFAHYLREPAVAKRQPRFTIVEHARVHTIDGGAVDTEGLPHQPWGLSWSKDGKRAIVVRGARIPARLRGRITFHNALHDLRVLRAMGMETRGLDFDDTMVMLYVLQLEPQALKNAAYRHLGMRMTEFDETVRPYFDKVALAWLEEAAEKEYQPWKEVAYEDFKSKRWRIYKAQAPGRRIRNLINGYKKDPAKKQLDKGWSELDDAEDGTRANRDSAERAMGSSYPEFSIFHVPRRKAVMYSGTDAIATALLKPVLTQLVEARGLSAVYEMDRRALPFVDRMQEVGMRVDVERLIALEADLVDVRARAAKKVRSIVGDRWFNPGSGDQVAAWLYDRKGLPVSKETDSGRGSTSDETLSMIRGYHADDEDVVEFVTAIQDYREADKYKGTFTDRIFALIEQDKDGDWRLHPQFRTTRAVSGRLTEPIVMLIPTRTTLGQRIRGCFVAKPGYVLLSCDLSMIELRMVAHLSRDRKMCQAFWDEQDLHALTASVVFKALLDAVTHAQRSVGKMLNFAVCYLISARSLLEQFYKAGVFDYTLRDCERFIAEWFGLYSGIPRWQHALWKQAEKDGFVRTMLGRVAYIPNLRVMDTDLLEAARRLAGNMPVQGSVADLVKRAQTRLHDHIEETGQRESVRPWLQLHDELILEVEEKRVAEVAEDVRYFMCADQALVRVPLKAKAAWAQSWGEVEK